MAKIQRIDLSDLMSHPLLNKDDNNNNKNNNNNDDDDNITTPDIKKLVAVSPALLTPSPQRNNISANSSAGLGLYNNDMPSPKPNILLPNFSISSYAESRRASWRE